MNDHPHTHDDGLSPAARSALAALRAEDELAPEVHDRMWSRLAAATAADAPLDMSARTGPKDQARRRGVLLGLAIAAGLTLTLLGVQRAAQPIARATRGDAAPYAGPGADERAARSAGGAAVPPSAETAAAVPVPEDMSITAAGDEPQPGVAPRRRPAPRVPVPGDSSAEAAPAASASALAAEAALLQRAQTALAAGQPEAALVLLEQHAREYPAGVLTPERAALRVVALCAAGREALGRAEAAEFLRAHAGSVLAGRVRGACSEG
jgi:hypothetical protein